MPRVSDRTIVTLDLKWAVLAASLLVTAGGAMWEIRSLKEQVRDLAAKTAQLDRSLVELTVTLKAREVIK